MGSSVPQLGQKRHFWDTGDSPSRVRHGYPGEEANGNEEGERAKEVDRSSSYQMSSPIKRSKQEKQIPFQKAEKERKSTAKGQMSDAAVALRLDRKLSQEVEASVRRKREEEEENERLLKQLLREEQEKEKEKEKMHERLCRDLIQQTGNSVVTCPNCQNVFEGVSGMQVPSSNKGKEQLSKEAAEHSAKYRFRCQCGTVFCSSCSTTPYHLGYTCSRWKSYLSSAKCHFCQEALKDAASVKSGVCSDEECEQKKKISCKKVLDCGHKCGGIKGEKRHLDCLEVSCAERQNLSQNRDQYCTICYCEDLGSAPAIQLACGHVFHYTCVKEKLSNKWPGARMTFGYLTCPTCKQRMSHPSINSIVAVQCNLRDRVQDMANERLEIEGLLQDPRLQPNGSYHKRQEEFAMDKLAFYQCHKCRQPYFGGQRRCQEAADPQAEQFDAEQLECGSCVVKRSGKKGECNLHGAAYMEYKCKFCCSVASWFCWGTTHFCNSCHDKQISGNHVTKKSYVCPACLGPGKCPLKVPHPPNGTKEFLLGCGMCRLQR